MLDYALKLTRTPGAMDRSDVAALRGHGFDDRAIHDICAVTGYFAFVNRIADGLGVEMEDYVLEAEERDRAVIDTSTWGKRNRP